MKKNYSDPLLFASRSILTSVGDLTPSQEGELPNRAARAIRNPAFSVNSYTAEPASEDPITIVNPVEEAVTSATTGATVGVTTESPVEAANEAVTTSPLKVESIIDEIVPEVTEEAATAGTTTY